MSRADLAYIDLVVVRLEVKLKRVKLVEGVLASRLSSRPRKFHFFISYRFEIYCVSAIGHQIHQTNSTASYELKTSHVERVSNLAEKISDLVSTIEWIVAIFSEQTFRLHCWHERSASH